MPGVFERRYLRLRVGAGFVLEQNIVIPVRIKRRVKIDQVNGLIRDVIPQDIQIIAVV
jgi:hypothetical protein